MEQWGQYRQPLIWCLGPWRRWHNSTGTQLWPDYGEVFGAFPEKSKQKLFYALLLRHLFKKHGYVPGVNFFNIPFDWRTGVQGLEQVRGGGGVVVAVTVQQLTLRPRRQ